MSVMLLDERGDLTVDDLDDTPDDGRRYELVDGTLYVTPAPIVAHQVVSARVIGALLPACPPGLLVLNPVDIVFADDTMLEPDVVVASAEHLRETRLTSPPLLVVEVLSRSTRRHDLMTKFSVYEEYGVASYWIADPNVDAPSLRAFELVDGRYAELANVTGDAAFEATRPFPVRIVPAELTQA